MILNMYHQDTTAMDSGRIVDEASIPKEISSIHERRRVLAQKRAATAGAQAKLDIAINQLLKALSDAEKKKSLISDRLESAMEQETLLKIAAKARRVNPTNDCFHIWHDGCFGTINGLRLGNYGGIVPWSEINAALGTAALLLYTLSARPGSDFRFSFDIVPMGSFTKITTRPKRKGDAVTVYNLFSDDSFQLFGKRSFNAALNMLLTCLKEAGDSVIIRDRTLAFPYPIETCGGRSSEFTIGGLSLAYESGGEIWTRALKYFLADLKWLTAFTTKNIDR